MSNIVQHETSRYPLVSGLSYQSYSVNSQLARSKSVANLTPSDLVVPFLEQMDREQMTKLWLASQTPTPCSLHLRDIEIDILEEQPYVAQIHIWRSSEQTVSLISPSYVLKSPQCSPTIPSMVSADILSRIHSGCIGDVQFQFAVFEDSPLLEQEGDENDAVQSSPRIECIEESAVAVVPSDPELSQKSVEESYDDDEMAPKIALKEDLVLPIPQSQEASKKTTQTHQAVRQSEKKSSSVQMEAAVPSDEDDSTPQRLLKTAKNDSLTQSCDELISSLDLLSQLCRAVSSPLFEVLLSMRTELPMRETVSARRVTSSSSKNSGLHAPSKSKKTHKSKRKQKVVAAATKKVSAAQLSPKNNSRPQAASKNKKTHKSKQKVAAAATKKVSAAQLSPKKTPPCTIESNSTVGQRAKVIQSAAQHKKIQPPAQPANSSKDTRSTHTTAKRATQAATPPSTKSEKQGLTKKEKSPKANQRVTAASTKKVSAAKLAVKEDQPPQNKPVPTATTTSTSATKLPEQKVSVHSGTDSREGVWVTVKTSQQLSATQRRRTEQENLLSTLKEGDGPETTYWFKDRVVRWYDPGRDPIIEDTTHFGAIQGDPILVAQQRFFHKVPLTVVSVLLRHGAKGDPVEGPRKFRRSCVFRLPGRVVIPDMERRRALGLLDDVMYGVFETTKVPEQGFNHVFFAMGRENYRNYYTLGSSLNTGGKRFRPIFSTFESDDQQLASDGSRVEQITYKSDGKPDEVTVRSTEGTLYTLSIP